MSWYQNLDARLEFGEKAIDLTIEKCELFLTGEIDFGFGSDDCPLCMVIFDDCEVCDLEIKCEDKNSLYRILYNFSLEGNVREMRNFVKETILPYLKELREKSDGKS